MGSEFRKFMLVVRSLDPSTSNHCFPRFLFDTMVPRPSTTGSMEVIPTSQYIISDLRLNRNLRGIINKDYNSMYHCIMAVLSLAQASLLLCLSSSKASRPSLSSSNLYIGKSSKSVLLMISGIGR